jgi:hypothetical protein
LTKQTHLAKLATPQEADLPLAEEQSPTAKSQLGYGDWLSKEVFQTLSNLRRSWDFKVSALNIRKQNCTALYSSTHPSLVNRVSLVKFSVL